MSEAVYTYRVTFKDLAQIAWERILGVDGLAEAKQLIPEPFGVLTEEETKLFHYTRYVLLKQGVNMVGDIFIQKKEESRGYKFSISKPLPRLRSTQGKKFISIIQETEMGSCALGGKPKMVAPSPPPSSSGTLKMVTATTTDREIIELAKREMAMKAAKEAASPAFAAAIQKSISPAIPDFDIKATMQEMQTQMAKVAAATAKRPVGRPRKPKAATSSDPGLEGELPRIDAKDPYYWSDFILQYRNQKIKTREEQTQFLHDLHRVFAVVLLAKSLYVFKSCPSDVFSIHTAPPDQKTQPYFYYNLVDGPGDGEGVRKWFLDWKGLDTLSYKRIDCIPFHPHLGMPDMDARILNTFGGFIANFVGDENGRISGKQKEKIQLFLNHVREVIAAGDDFVYRYTMGWYRGMLLPDKEGNIRMTLIAPLFKGPQRSGKNIVLDMLRDHVFGHNCSMEVDGTGDLTDRFNPELAGKILVVVNESKESESDIKLSSRDSEKIKNRITGKTIWVEGKRENKVEYTNRLNITFCSNHILSLHTTQDDGRIPQFEVSGHRVGDHAYFDALGDSFTQEAGDILYTYLLSDEVETMNLKTIPKTQTRIDAIELSMGSPDRFLVELLAGRIAIPRLNIRRKGKEDDFAVSTLSLRILYQDFIREHMPSSKPCSDKIFTQKIKGGPGMPSKYFQHIPNIKFGTKNQTGFKILKPAWDVLRVDMPRDLCDTGDDVHCDFRAAMGLPPAEIDPNLPKPEPIVEYD